MQGWGHLVASFYITAALSSLLYLSSLSSESLCLPRKFQVEKVFLKGAEGKAKIGSPWRTSFGAISHSFLCQFLKVQGQCFLSPVVIWHQVTLLKTFYFRYEKVAWDPVWKEHSYYLCGESSWSITDVQQYDKTGTVLSSLGKGLSFSSMLI